MKPTMRAVVVVAIVAGMCATQLTAEQRAAPSASFEPIGAVLSSPRCANCHVSGDAPLQGDAGRRHAMRVQRGRDGRGTVAMRCTNCHQNASAVLHHAPPGAPDWRLPPPSTPMAWSGLSPGEQCRMLKDTSKNGKKTLAELFEHVQRDPLVLAGWRPGPGRALPPLSHDAFVAQFRVWIEQGAVCPD